MSSARIRIGKSANSIDCSVIFTEEPGGLVVASGSFPLADLDSGSPTRVEMLAAVRDNLAPDSVFVRTGEKLFKVLADAGIGEAWRGRHGQHERTFLEIEDDLLSDLPWELLCKMEEGTPTRFFVDPRHPIVRWHKKDVARTLAESPVLRILVVTGEKAAGDAAFPSEEVHAIRRAFQGCDQGAYLEVLEQPATPDVLRDRLRELRPHVLHFVGHGGIHHQTGFRGLLFGPINAPIWCWDADAISTGFLGLGWAPRLVVLNACHSGEGDDTLGKMLMAPIAKQFARRGALAVVGLQATVRQDRSEQFARAFYRQLAEGKDIDRVCAEVRLELGQSDAGTGWHRRDWALPALSMACDPGQILPMRAATSRLRACPALGVFFRRNGPSPFVDRSDQRRQVLSALHPFVQDDPASTCVVVIGPEGAGKSWLGKRCSRDLAHAGVIVRHCDLSQGVGLTFVDILRQIQAGDPQQPDSVIHQPLPAEHFTDFEKLADDYIAGRQDPKFIGRVCTAFRQGLAATAAGSSLLLVFDHLAEPGRGSVQPDEFKLSLLPELIKPIAAGDVPGVRLVVIGTSTEIEAFGLANLAKLSLAREVPLANFGPGDFASLFYEFCRFQRSEKLTKIREFWDQESIGNAPWSPLQFQELSKYVARHLQ